MAQHVEQHRLDVLGADEVASAQPGVGARAAVEGDGAARAGAVGDPFGEFRVVLGRGAGGHDQLHQVFLHRVGHVQAEDFLARGEDGFLGHPALRPGLAVQCLATRLLEDAAFHRSLRVADLDVHEEAVELGFRQRVGAFLLDRVLCRHHQEQLWQVVGAAADRNLALGHGFEQRRLHLGRGAVDLVGQHQVMEDRALLEHEGAGLRTVDLGAGDVGGEQVGSELDTVELGFEAFGEVLDGLGLGQSRRAFHQQVAVG